MDIDFIRRAVAASDLAALRIALYQASGDPELERLGPVLSLSPEDQQRLAERCVELIATGLGSYTYRVPDDAELRHLMDLVLGRPTSDADFAFRRHALGFEEWPFMWTWPERPHPVPEGFCVAIIGAGFSGLCMGVQLAQLGIPFVIYEKRDELGGTWSRHRYPDIRVDTASLNYELNFEKHFKWSEYFARGPEVRSYLEHVARKYGVFEHIHFGHELAEARFDDTTDTWEVELRRTDCTLVTRRVNAVVSAVGLFLNPRPFDVPGIDDFQGTIVHPTAWPDDLDLAGKRVAVIGNGSTGVQLLAPVAEEAAHVSVFQRTVQWIAPRPKYGQPMEAEHSWLSENVPCYWEWCHYTSVMHLFNSLEDFMVEDPEWKAQGGLVSQKSDQLRAFLTNYIKAQVGDRPDLIERLVPDYPPMLRRPVVDNGWYKALTRANVELVTDPITRFTKTRIVTTDGTEREFDVVVTATGFEVVKFLWPSRYVGTGGVDLHERWEREEPRAYGGVLVPGFPNMFIMYGPNSQPLSGGIGLPNWYQIWSGFIAQCLTGMIDAGCTRVEVTEAAFWAYNDRLDEEGAKTVLVQDAASASKNYYVADSGRLLVNCPLKAGEFYSFVAHPDPEHIKYS